MRHSIGLAWIAGFLFASAAPLSAQTTIQRARDVLADKKPAPVQPVRVEPPRPTTTTIIVPQREVVVIERVHARTGWWNQPKYRAITMYYDGSRFYRRPFDRRPLRKVVVYQSAGHYYIDEVQWKRDHRRYYGRDYDGWKDNDSRRHNDRWDNNGRKDDDKWKNDDRRRDDDKRNNDDKRNSDDRRKDDHDKDGKGNNGRHLGQYKDKHND